MQRPIAMLALLACAVAAKGAHVPPQSAMVADRAVESIVNDVSADRLADAIERVQPLLVDENAKYIRVDDRLLAIRVWVESQLGAKRDAFIAQYEKSLGAIATTELSAAMREGSVHAVMRVASRYPWTSAARKAPETAARLAIERGDIASARALIERSGSNISDARLLKLKEIPTDSVLPAAAFSAGWYSAFFPGLEGRVVPVASKELIVVATTRSVLAMSPDGKTLWSTGRPEPLKLEGESRGKPKSVPTPKDRSLSWPVVWCDLSGRPRVVVARIVESTGAYLRAYSADDGRLIWSTVDDDATRDLVMTGAPAAAGGYVYFNAVRFDPASGLHTIVGALDLATGKLAWSTDVGEVNQRVTGQQKKTDTEIDGPVRGVLQTADASAQVTFDAHHVYVVLGPTVIAVDRFSGAGAWFSKYPNRPLDEKQLDRERNSKTPPMYRRWRDVAVSDGKNVVVAPIDSDLVLALDAATGAIKWKEDGLRGSELVGMSQGRALFAGASLAALEMGTGETAWQNALPDADFVGPAFVDGDLLGVMTDRGPAYFDLDRGLAAKRRGTKVQPFDPIFRQANARQALQQVEAIEYFDRANR